MRQIFEIKDKKIIDEVLQSVEYGTLALCHENRPYSLPLNFVKLGDFIYFHGSKNGRKVEILRQNSFVSFSVVESCSLIPSYFSSKDALACPATQFFKSIMIEGKVEFIEDSAQKVEVLSAMMKKLQKEGGYRALSQSVYDEVISATLVYKLTPISTCAKFKLGQHLSQERFDMIIENLEKRGGFKDISTAKLMREFRKD